LLLDTCVWGGALSVLRDAGHDVVWTGDWEKDPGDQEILRQAHQQDRILITLDKDFGERAIVYGEPHRGIIRLMGIPARMQAEFCARTLERYGSQLTQGAIVTAEPQRTRIRIPE
jgi:predicted nuclease of predicted toxin-antitoxin system